MGNSTTDEQKRQIISLAKEYVITLNGYTAEFTANKDDVTIFDVDTFEMINISYQDFEKGLLTNNAKFKTK